MKIYREGDDGEQILAGWAAVRQDAGPVVRAPAGAPSRRQEAYTIGTVTRFHDAHIIVERAVFLAQGQPPELLPGWAPADA